MNDCIFCKIIKGEIPSEKVYDDDKFFVFKDINPQAEIHLIAIPKKHHENVAALEENDEVLGGELLSLMAKLGKDFSVELEKSSGNAEKPHFKLIFNTGEKSGQTVFHVHGHILAGKGLENLGF